jgi:hypothetical protein
MNIFILDKDLKKSAQYHCDRHVVKMILEHAQMMSTAVRLSGIDAGYKITHKNHPCAKWVRESLSNFNWLYDATFYLNLEYRYRFNHKVNHKSFDLIDSLPQPNIDDIGLTPFAQAMPDKYKNENAVIAYRRYYVFEKSHLFSWAKRPVPEWLDWYNE